MKSIIFVLPTSLSSAFLYDSDFSAIITPVDVEVWKNNTNFEQAQKNPTKTKSIDFRLRGQTGWTLQIGLSQVDASKAAGFGNVGIYENPVVLFTSYSLEWRGSKSLQLTIAPRSNVFSKESLYCISELPVLFLVDIVNTFQGGFNCDSVFGKKYMDTILRNFTLEPNGFKLVTLSNSKKYFDIDFFTINKYKDIINNFIILSYSKQYPSPCRHALGFRKYKQLLRQRRLNFAANNNGETGDLPCHSGDPFLYSLLYIRNIPQRQSNSALPTASEIGRCNVPRKRADAALFPLR